jgi:hypothetical protein
MKKHIVVEHPIVWHKWKSANVDFDPEELHQEKIYYWLWGHHRAFSKCQFLQE